MENQRRAPIALFLFAGIIVLPMLILNIAGFTIVSKQQATFANLSNQNILLQQKLDEKQQVTPTPTASPSATPTPTKSYYNYYSPTPAVK